ncbi:class I SAM-dependent DNA methyltransferase [Brachyspira aalborgi]|uniref:Class I SAM-dependent DNA methyltransferase n=1 Tax=Brachyspira aalborgi TaxID=29522 RepID=A0A5C8FJQ4_9SPIR|nr:class I SAM-dependent DNA methyltransferase [Brachyspira aalborgi]TXJ50337.1 class I SAM-dependent DNA methyltransferase [Brachyspira aalborgi]
MKLILLFFNWIASPSARNDYLIYSEVDKNTLKEIENLVDEILKIKNKNFNGDVSKYEGKIDKIVYWLYGLSEEEVGIIEGKD